MIYALFDFETTGLPLHPSVSLTKQPKPIEFGGVLTDGKNIISELEFIVNPEMEIESIITKITGLTNEDLEIAETFDKFIPKLKEFFSQADVAIAHNLSFDKEILNMALNRLNLQLYSVSFPSIQICTVEQMYPIFGRRIKLQDWFERHNGKYVQKHRALDDVLLMHQACLKEGIYEIFDNKDFE